MRKRVLSLLLALAMLCALLPQASPRAAAEDVYSGSCGANGDNLTWTFDPDTGTLTIEGSGDMENRPPWYSYKDAITTVSLPEGITSIGDFAFSDCKELVSVELPKSLTSIGVQAFCECRSLTSMTIPGSVDRVEDEAFRFCTGLTSLTIHDGVSYLGEYSFWGCTALTSVTIPGSVTGDMHSTFWDCTGLTEVTVLEGVSTVGPGTFKFCTSLTTVTLPASITYIWSDAFNNCPALTTVILYSRNCYIKATATTLGDPEQSLLYGYLGSTLQEYAVQRGYTFCPLDGFFDVDPGSYYAVPAAWAYANGITTGTGNGYFSPNQGCTREQIMTFLWRANGSPEPTSSENPFADVSETDYYYKAVLWAVENGITSGVDPTNFGVGCGCSRAQAATFLWAAAGKPEPATTENPFTDVQPMDYYYKAVLWAVENGVTSGTSPSSFSPRQSCTRAQIVTFLFREYG